jgi:DNA gyrase/topoisomerase IV subunit B
VEAMAKLEELARAVERRGVPMNAYLTAEKDGHLPWERWRTLPQGAWEFVRTSQGHDRRLKELADQLGREPTIFEEGGDPKGRATADAIVMRFYEAPEIEKVARVIARLGLDPKAWSSPPPAERKAAKPIGRFVPEGGDAIDVLSLKDLLAEVRKAGQRGVDIQRYKGLGEMNPDQLRATTMDPERRTLVQMRVPDLRDSTNRMFGILMGESVEPRKDFIERHAGEVTNLDV